MPNDAPDWTSAVQVSDTVLVAGSPFSVAQDGLPHTLGVFAVPVAAHGIAFTFPTPANIAQLQVIGQTSGIDYAASSSAGVSQTVTTKLYSAIDTQVKVIVTTNIVGGTQLVSCAFILDTLVVTVDSDEPGRIVLVDNLGGVIGFDTAANGQLSIAVSEKFANPAPWQAARAVAVVNVNLGAAGITHIIPGVAGKTIYIHTIAYGVSAAGAFSGNFQDTAGAPVNFGGDTFQNGDHRTRPYNGAPMAAGVGLDWNTVNAGASFLGGYVTYTQQ